MESLLLLFEPLLLLLLPLLLLPVHPLVQSGIIESILFVPLALPSDLIIDVMVFVESLVFLFKVGVHVTRSDDCYYGLKIRVPAVWKRVWNPTKIRKGSTAIVNSLMLDFIPVD